MMTNKLHHAYFIQCVSSFCHAVFFPLLGVWLFKERLFSCGEVAVIVSGSVLSYRLAGLLFANIVRRSHKKFIIIGSLSSISVLYTLFFFIAINRIAILPLWLAFAVLVGSMLSVTSLAVLSYAASHSPPSGDNQHQMPFAVLNIAVNLGAGVGPFIGAVALTYSQHLFLLLPILFAIIAILASSRLALDKQSEVHTSREARFHVLSRNFVLLVVINMLTCVAYPQFYEVLPAYAMETIDQQAIGVLFCISGVVIILLQIPIAKLTCRMPSTLSIAISNLILAVGTILFVPAREGYFATCVLGTILISVAEIIYTPLYQSLAIQLLDAENQVLGLAILSFAWGIVEAAASFAGIFAIGHGYGHLSLLIGAIAAFGVSLIGFLRFGIRLSGNLDRSFATRSGCSLRAAI